MCDCYQIGGPFIAEDPDCPVHGTEAQQRREDEQEEREGPMRARIEALEARIDLLEGVIQEIQGRAARGGY